MPVKSGVSIQLNVRKQSSHATGRFLVACAGRLDNIGHNGNGGSAHSQTNLGYIIFGQLESRRHE